MTNEEIELLKNFITWQSLPFVDNLFTHEDDIIKKFDEWLRLKDEALELAIKALEQQPCEDCFTDEEKRIFLASVAREMRVCEQIDSEKTKVKLVPILERVKDKVLRSSLWEEKE